MNARSGKAKSHHEGTETRGNKSGRKKAVDNRIAGNRYAGSSENQAQLPDYSITRLQITQLPNSSPCLRASVVRFAFPITRRLLAIPAIRYNRAMPTGPETREKFLRFFESK